MRQAGEERSVVRESFREEILDLSLKELGFGYACGRESRRVF